MRRTYSNLDDVSTLKSFSELIAWQKERRAKQKDLSFQVPLCEHKQTGWLQSNRTETSLTWIGHSSFLLQIGGLNILTDPVWAQRMGFAGRLAPPGLALEELPEIDIILLSHGHYDHMDLPTLHKLRKRSISEPMLLVPSGLAEVLRKKGFGRIAELEWWASMRIGAVEFHFVPAQHWTRRTLWDTNRSHWGGWMIINAESDDSIYFAGDSGYFRGFGLIGEKFSPRYVLMPIGAYEPEWFMSKQHVNPEEAVQAFIDVRGGVMIPMHYGAFRLADDTPKEALDRLYAEWNRRGLAGECLKVLAVGETLRDAHDKPALPEREARIGSPGR
ncbi:MBL fold metallo-hydrolase [Paenibacillus hamazuiensis]|uniref:MBL fold metallo-hydrolase n=1 Tax=Paenibacillus hamazuiensis TaxID=2936508 RepID=UPI003B849B78